MIIAIDFDGTIVSHKYPHTGDPRPGVKQAIDKLRSKGYYILIYSCRTSTEINDTDDGCIQQAQIITDTLNRYDIPFDEICMYNKPIAIAYFDDRAIAVPEVPVGNDDVMWANAIETFEQIEKNVLQKVPPNCQQTAMLARAALIRLKWQQRKMTPTIEPHGFSRGSMSVGKM